MGPAHHAQADDSDVHGHSVNAKGTTDKHGWTQIACLNPCSSVFIRGYMFTIFSIAARVRGSSVFSGGIISATIVLS